MNFTLRKWRLSDGKDLAAALNNEKILKNLRDGLPFPYTEQDGAEYISAMLPFANNLIVLSLPLFRSVRLLEKSAQ